MGLGQETRDAGWLHTSFQSPSNQSPGTWQEFTGRVFNRAGACHDTDGHTTKGSQATIWAAYSVEFLRQQRDNKQEKG